MKAKTWAERSRVSVSPQRYIVGREERDERGAGPGAPGRAEEPPLEGERDGEQHEVEGRIQVVRAIVAEEPDPGREQHRKARRVAAVESPVVVDVGLGEDVGAGGEERLERLAAGPIVEDPAVQQVVGEAEVAELVDGQVPGDLPLERDRGGAEERERRGHPRRSTWRARA